MLWLSFCDGYLFEVREVNKLASICDCKAECVSRQQGSDINIQYQQSISCLHTQTNTIIKYKILIYDVNFIQMLTPDDFEVKQTNVIVEK